MKKHPDLKKHQYREPINNLNKSTETYLIKSKYEYKNIKKLVKENKSAYDQNINALQLITKAKEYDLHNTILSKCANTDEFFDVLSKLSESSNDLDRNVPPIKINENSGIEDQDINFEEKLARQAKKEALGDEYKNVRNSKSYGPYVQLYDGADTSKLLKVFDGILEATRQMQNTSSSQIKTSSKHKTLYHGYRWYLVDRRDPTPHEVKEIGKTVKTAQKRMGFVAMMDIEKSFVKRVFESQLKAAEYVFQSPAAICTAVKYGSAISGHFWTNWEEVDSSLREAFTNSNTIPCRKPNIRGKQITRTNPVTNEVVCVYNSLSEAAREAKVSINSIKLANSLKHIHQSTYWKIE